MGTPQPSSVATLDGPEPPRAPKKAEAEHRAGTLIAGRYRLESRLGAGAMGEVWRARHEELNIDVAVKLALVHEDDSDRDRMLERFRFEAQTSAQLSQHTEHIVAVSDAGRHNDVPFMVMEYVPGHTLDDVINAAGRLPVGRVADVVDQVCRALSAAHGHRIWHRDIKGSNIMVTERPSGEWQLKVTDFGVAKSMSSQLDVDAPKTTVEGVLIGTPTYMSPEQISGAAPDAQSDLWSLAVTAYEALTGTTPFHGKTLAELIGNIGTGPHIPPSVRVPVPATVDAWFARALAKQPAQRFESADEMARTFRAAAAASRTRWPWFVGAGALAAVAVVVYFVGWHVPDVAESATPSAAVPTAEVGPTPSTDREPSAPAPTISAPRPSPPKPAKTQPPKAQPPTVEPAPSSLPEPAPNPKPQPTSEEDKDLVQ